MEEKKKELIKKLNFDVKELFTTKLALIKYMCKCKLRDQTKLTSELFLVFSDDLIEWLKNENVDVLDIIIPSSTEKTVDQLRDQIFDAANYSTKKMMSNAVCVNTADGWRNCFNMNAEPEHIKKLIPLLHEMAIAMKK